MLVGAQGSYHEVGVLFAKLRICGESIMLATSRIIDAVAASWHHIYILRRCGISKLLPTIITLVHAAFFAQVLLRRSWPPPCWATFVFAQWGQHKKELGLGLPFLSYPATKSVQLTTRDYDDNFPTLVMVESLTCSNVRTHQVPTIKFLSFAICTLGSVCGRKKLVLLQITYYNNIYLDRVLRHPQNSRATNSILTLEYNGNSLSYHHLYS